MPVKIQIRRDTAANWTASNPRLASGEFGYETNTNKLKIGDGTSTWNALSYFAGTGGGTATGGADSDWVIRTIKRLDLDSDWVLRQTPKVQADSDWITRNFKEKADSDWVIRTIKRLDVDSDWITRQIGLNKLDSEWVVKQTYKYSKEWHVDPVNGKDSDTTYTGSYTRPFKTFGKAAAVAGNTGEIIFLHAGTYNESVNFSDLNVDIVGDNANGGIINVTGTTTFSHASSSVRVAGIRFGTVVHSGAGSLYINGGQVTTLFTKSSAGYFEATDAEFQGSTMAVTGAGFANFFGGKTGTLTVNNSSAIVTIKGSTNSTPITVTSGTCLVQESIVFGATTTGNVISGAGTVYIVNSSIYNSLGAAGRISLTGIHSISNTNYDRANSTTSGTNVGTVTRFDQLAIDGTVPQITTAKKFLTRNASNQIVEQQIQIDSDYLGRSTGFTGGIQGAHLTFGGYRLTEKFTTLTANPSGTTTLDTSVNSLFYVAGTSNAWTANLSSVNIAIGESCAVTIVCVNGATANFPSSWAYNSTAITARTLNGVVYTANPNKTDIINATLMRTGASAYILIVSLSSYA